MKIIEYFKERRGRDSQDVNMPRKQAAYQDFKCKVVGNPYEGFRRI